jgi:L-seryl-tRNA(Ser) seleniumtransferase
MADDRFRALPAVEVLVERVLGGQGEAAPALPRPVLVDAARETLSAERARLAADPGRIPDSDEVRVAAVVATARRLARAEQRRVVNATGVVLHTNLGRAPLSEAVRKAIEAAAGGYLTLEYDVPQGRRSERALGVERLLCRITGAEAALCVNNGAAAVLLGVSALAQGKRVIVSRGELVEIGGSFRLPEILAKAGAVLTEVGTTNRTRIDDYKRAITPDTALVLRVHPSNFRVVGFHERPALDELAALAHEAKLPLLEDVGSGALVDTTRFGLEREPTVKESLTAGADVVTFSADKLLGGPQAGLAVGRREWIARLKRDPLARALRVDKLIIAALEATLIAYLDPTRAEGELPVLAMLSAPIERLCAFAEGLRARIADVPGLDVSVVAETGEVGGGALPGAALPTAALALSWAGGSAVSLEQRLRLGRTPLIARIKDDRVLLDARTLLFEDPDEVATLVRDAATRAAEREPDEGDDPCS